MNWIVEKKRSKESVLSYIQACLPKVRELHLIETSSIFLESRRFAGKITLFLHSAFLHASDEVLQALSAYLKKKEQKTLSCLRLFMDHPFFRKPVVLQSSQIKGVCYDLASIYREIEQDHIGFSIGATISWRKFPVRKQIRSITYGRFFRRDQHIEINRLLDHPSVPKYFVSYITYHEALHALFPPQLSRDGRILVHTKDFKKKERLFPRYTEAKAFEKHFFSRRKSNVLEIYGRT